MKKIASVITTLLVVGSLAGVARGREARRPANDDLLTAATIPALPFSQTISLKGATLELDEVQPSCQPVRSTVWFSFSVPEGNNVIADLSSTFGSAITIFEQTSEGVVERACSTANSDEKEFQASTNNVYLVQVGATSAKQGLVDLSLRFSEWRSQTLSEYNYHRESDEVRIPVLGVKAAPREKDTAMYDVQIRLSDRQPTKVGVLTFGLVTQKVEAELLNIPASTTDVRVTVSSRYDSDQYTCGVDNGEDACHAGTPLSDLDWLTSGKGSRAELVITLRAERNGDVLQERSLTVPYAGQPTGLIP